MQPGLLTRAQQPQVAASQSPDQDAPSTNTGTTVPNAGAHTLQDPRLQQMKEAADQSAQYLPPALQAQYHGAVVAAMKIMFSPARHASTMQFLSDVRDEQTVPMAAAYATMYVVTLTVKESKGGLRPPVSGLVIVPILSECLQLAEIKLGVKLSEDTIGQAHGKVIQLLKQYYRISDGQIHQLQAQAKGAGQPPVPSPSAASPPQGGA